LVDRLACVSILGLKPGAVLARAVLRPDGVVLLPAGQALDIDLLRQLGRRGIECVHVLLEETRDPMQIERDVALSVTRVAFLFRGPGSPARDELASAITSYRRQQVS
jgi:hypothetical protein